MSSQYTISALYKFVSLPNFKEIREPLRQKMEDLAIRGTLLLAHEGINGTIAGPNASIKALFTWLAQYEGLNNIVSKESYSDFPPFKRTKVKLKKEIVTMGVEDIDPNTCVGEYVEPKDWNSLISRDDVVLVDTRNDYEYEIGTFKDAINPETETFREFPEYVQKNLDPNKHKSVAMFCTGGIRCEKSTALLKKYGFEKVYHLKGGILKYLEDVPAEESLWEGECFVFDDRVAVKHDLGVGHYKQCFACRYPITEDDEKSDKYIKGVSCPRCFDKSTKEQKQRFAERQKQIALAKAKGEEHIGKRIEH